MMATDNAFSATTTTTQENEIPKSPPKWPLRPGVLVHVKNDTKEQLHAVRIQNPINHKTESSPSTLSSQALQLNVINNNNNNTGTSSMSNLSHKNPFRISRCDSNSLNESVAKTSSNDELIKFINSKLLQRILRKLKLRRINIKEVSEEDDEPTKDEFSFKRRNEYRFRIQSKACWRSNWDTWAWFSSNKSTRSNKSLMNTSNHFRGIECTENGKMFSLQNFLFRKF